MTGFLEGSVMIAETFAHLGGGAISVRHDPYLSKILAAALTER